MKLFQATGPLALFTATLFTTVFATVLAAPAMADSRHYGNHYNTRYGNFGTGYRNDGWSMRITARTRYGSWRSNAWNSRYRYRGSYDSGFTTGFLYGSVLGSAAGAWYEPRYSNRTTVIYKEPTVVYVNEISRPTGRIQGTPVARSLLRDIHGDCFERTTDVNGRETRVQLPASACDF